MKEKDRVLELVKKGIMSTEEALILLENMATEKDEKQIEKVAEQVDTTKQGEPTIPDAATQLVSHLEEQASEPEAPEVTEDDVAAQKQADHERLEKILDELATKANCASAELDEINVEIGGVKVQISEANEKVMELNTKEELGELDEAEQAERKKFEAELHELETKMAELGQEKVAIEAKLKDIKKEQWNERKERVAAKLDLPDDWKEQASDTFNQMGEKMTEAGSQLGSFFKKTFRTMSETVNDNVEWKDINLKVPGVATSKFTHEFNYPEPQASLIDVKVANGNVIFKTWDQENVRVEASIKLYGKMNTESPLEAFLERSQIDVDDEVISFQIPNKRVRADLVFYLPARTYDHVSVKLLNGDIKVESLQAKDVYAKSTNGTIDFQTIEATMLEIEGVNGNIKVADGQVLDSIIESVNGTITITAAIHALSTSLINGDVRITASTDHVKKIHAHTVNGNVKIAVPTTLGFEGLAKTNLGAINSRLSDYEVVREKKEKANQLLQFQRVQTENMAQIEASTTTGSIYLKDTELTTN